MTPDDFRQLIAALGLSQTSAAKLLGVGERTVRHWALGDREIPPPAQRLLWTLQDFDIAPSEAYKAFTQRARRRP